MSILVTCPNGHALKVEDKFAGRTGRCPTCQVAVAVPKPESSSIDEDAILDLLGSTDGDRSAGERAGGLAAGSNISRRATTEAEAKSGIKEGRKRCPHCRREVRASLHICPGCHRYFSDSTQFAREASRYCLECGNEWIPGDVRCSACGTEFN